MDVGSSGWEKKKLCMSQDTLPASPLPLRQAAARKREGEVGGAGLMLFWGQTFSRGARIRVTHWATTRQLSSGRRRRATKGAIFFGDRPLANFFSPTTSALWAMLRAPLVSSPSPTLVFRRPLVRITTFPLPPHLSFPPSPPRREPCPLLLLFPLFPFFLSAACEIVIACRYPPPPLSPRPRTREASSPGEQTEVQFSVRRGGFKVHERTIISWRRERDYRDPWRCR